MSKANDTRVRCAWVGNDALYQRYHDAEWGVPLKTDRAIFEKLVLEGFQAGLSWITILRKRENFRGAFDKFDAERIAKYGTKDVARLMADAGIVRNRAKIEATIDNAKAYLKLRDRTSLKTFMQDFLGKDGPVQNRARAMGDIPAETELSKRISKALKAEGFRFVGPTTVYAFMQSSGMVNDHLVSCFRSCRMRQASTREHQAVTRADDSKAPGRAWQRMLSGRRLDLLNPSPDDIEIEDIAHGLARVARWNGQTVGAHAFSVAQHSLLVETIAGEIDADWPAQWRLAALLHDAPEYVVGDLISPFKTAIGLDYKAFELRLLAAIHQRFGLPDILPTDVQAKIKAADRLAAYFEATQLAGFTIEEATIYFGQPRGLAPEVARVLAGLEPWDTAQVQHAFLKRFRDLIERL